MRALAAVAIGYDVNIGSFKSIGPATIYNKMKEFSDKKMAVYGSLLNFVTTKSNTDKNVVETYIHAFLCEPANDVSQTTEEMHYIFAKPTTLPKYLEEFSLDGIIIVDDPKTVTCLGYSIDSNHIFLKAEGYKNCFMCNGIVCKTCVVDIHENDKRQQFCMECYKTIALTGFISNKNGTNSKTLRGMTDILNDGGYNLHADTLPNEIEEMYESLVVTGSCSEHSNLADKVIFPIHSSDVLIGKSGGLGKELVSFNLCDGGYFHCRPHKNKG